MNCVDWRCVKINQGETSLNARRILRIYYGGLNPAHIARIRGQSQLLKEQSELVHELLIARRRRRTAEPLPKAIGKLVDEVIVIDSPSMSQSITQLFRTLRDRQAHVVHAHKLWVTLLVGILARFLPNRPRIIYEIHGAVAFEALSRHRRLDRWGRFVFLYALESVAILLADRLLLVSEEIKRYYPVARLKKSISIPRVLTSSPESSDPPSNSLREIARFSSLARLAGQTVLVYSGGLASWQCFEETVRLMRHSIKHANCAGVILTYDVSRATRIVNKANGGPLANMLIVSVEQQEVVSALRYCDVGFLLREDTVTNRVASPTKFFEYLAAGLHVVVTPGAANVAPIVSRDNVGLVSDFGKLDSDLPDWLGRLQRTDTEIARVVRVAQRYTWQAYSDTYISLYDA